MEQQRLRLSIQGRVQGVGFRPFIWRTARRHQLTGFVRNTGEGVTVELQGSAANLLAFRHALDDDLPPLAHIDQLQQALLDPVGDETAFVIEESAGSTTRARLPADIATCPSCLTELFTQSDRRYRYPFINCTDCGPRYTVTHRLPYDRANTSMVAFPLCPACGEEYLNPETRRFHAEPTACPACGPRLQLTDRFGQPLKGDPVYGAMQILRMGRSIAMKGLGGFHLVCDARSADAVQRLRELKHRPGKPLAVMALNTASLPAFCEVSAEEAQWLERPERPIVLLRKNRDTDHCLPGVAPGIGAVGVMLPYTPLQWMLFHEALGRPAGTDWLHEPCDKVWVMTSANLSGEPIVTGNQEARERLNRVADVFLLHNRNIVTRCDDSVLSVQEQEALFFRRARGFVPDPVKLADDGPNVLALGAYLKTTATVLRGDEAFVSQHIGDLDHPLTCEALEEAAEHLLELTGAEPQAIACDLQPDAFSSHLAEQWSRERGIPLIPVQHHHAHLAAVMAEHGLQGPVLGMALDGYGLGKNGGAWGGELMLVEAAVCERIGHISPLPLPGGDKAAREPWRMAAALYARLGMLDRLPAHLAQESGLPMLLRQLETGVNCHDTTSLGRWFDAIAGLAGLCPVQSFESEAAQKLEALARPCEPLSDGWTLSSANLLDFLPLARHLATLTDAADIASLWHSTLAHALADWAVRASRTTGIRKLVLGGGCCANRRLMEQLLPLLKQQGITAHTAHRLPPNDGGLSLGQAWVARHRLLQKEN
ncbi:carbamoyltransferase HypF [uncultured Aquitalea sp.]|uniref:carbamoyltransferase HypF n=1 Tax=uncultured Aquitalea sp. TaxID=540272 RepID=UPI0025FC9DFD|nr:carbamoyltransferase HypF [uncultured Aquitalea sp.]